MKIITKVVRRIFGILMTFLILSYVTPIVADASTISSEYSYRMNDDGTIMLVDYIGNDIDISIPEKIDGYTVTAIGGECFFYNKQIQSVTIPKTVSLLYKEMGEGEVFTYNFNISKIIVNDENQYYSSEDGILYNKDKTRLIYFPAKSNIEHFKVPDTVNEINSFAFMINKNLKSLEFPDHIINIYNQAFSGMDSIEYIIYPKVNPDIITSIFNDCKTHIDVIIPRDISYMNDLDFAGSDVTLYVYDNTYGLEWAKSHDFPYVIMEETPIQKDLVDEETGIQVSGIMDTDATLKVESVENTVENAVTTFDITLVKDGNIIQPDDEITITIPSEYGDCDVFWIKDDGSKVNMNAKYVDGKYVFATDHLSVYALVREEKSTTGTDTTESVEPTTLPVVTAPVTTEPVESTTDVIPTQTDPTDPTSTEYITTAPEETTVPESTEATTADVVTTQDTPNSGNGSNTPSSNTNTSNDAVATGDMFGIDNSILIALILAATTAMIIANKKKKDSSK